MIVSGTILGLFTAIVLSSLYDVIKTRRRRRIETSYEQDNIIDIPLGSFYVGDDEGKFIVKHIDPCIGNEYPQYHITRARVIRAVIELYGLDSKTSTYSLDRYRTTVIDLYRDMLGAEYGNNPHVIASFITTLSKMVKDGYILSLLEDMVDISKTPLFFEMDRLYAYFDDPPAKVTTRYIVERYKHGMDLKTHRKLAAGKLEEYEVYLSDDLIPDGFEPEGDVDAEHWMVVLKDDSGWGLPTLVLEEPDYEYNPYTNIEGLNQDLMAYDIDIGIQGNV